MAGLQISHILVVFCATVTLNCVSALPRDIIFPTGDENVVENSEITYPQPVNSQVLEMTEQEDKPKSCFHFYVSRNMSSLLAEATKMLRTIRDRREREWILTFIYRIKSLAEHLRTHPDSRNYDCLPTDEEAKKRILSDNVKGQQQPELYFVDEVPKRSSEGEDASSEKPSERNSSDNQEPTQAPKAEKQSVSNAPSKPDSRQPSLNIHTESSVETASDNTLTESVDDQKDLSTSKQDVTDTSQSQDSAQVNDDKSEPDKRKHTDDSSIVLSSSPDCDSSAECKNGQASSPSQLSSDNYFADAGNIYPMYQSEETREQDFDAAEMREVLKDRIRKALLEELATEIKKLKTVGGTEDDLMALWNSHYVQDKSEEGNEEADFDYEETGAAAGDPNLSERSAQQPDRTVAPSLDEVHNSRENSKDSPSYEPYDDSDVLVQQLFDVRYNNNPPAKTTKSLGDQNNEYLISSTHSPF